MTRWVLITVFFFNLCQATPVETEIYVYDFNDLIGDVGGILGLLLGASLMSGIDFVINCVKKKKRQYTGMYLPQL